MHGLFTIHDYFTHENGSRVLVTYNRFTKKIKNAFFKHNEYGKWHRIPESLWEEEGLKLFSESPEQIMAKIRKANS